MTLPTKAEFQARVQRHLRWVLAYGVPVFVLIMAAVVWWQVTGDSRSSQAQLIGWAVIVAVAASDFWFLYVFMARWLGLACPSCGSSTVSRYRERGAVARGECPWCGARLWREE